MNLTYTMYKNVYKACKVKHLSENLADKTNFYLNSVS